MAGLFRNVVERLVLVNVAAAELPLGEHLACHTPDPAGGAGLSRGQRRSGRRMLIQDDTNGVDGGTENLGDMLDRCAVVDELVQAHNIDEGRVRPGKVEIGEQADRRIPGDRFASHPVLYEEPPGRLVQRSGEFRGADSGEACCFGTELSFTEAALQTAIA